MTRHRHFVVATLSSLVLLVPSVAHAQDDEFKKAIDARNQKQWDRVIELMDAARARMPEDGHSPYNAFQRLVPGRPPYLPDMFIGEAYLNKGDCVRALAAWARSRKIGVFAQHKDWSPILENGEAECARRGVLGPEEYERVRSGLDARLADARGRLAQIDQTAQRSGGWSAHGNWAQQYQSAAADVDAADTRVKAAAQSHLRAELTEATTLVERANGTMGPLGEAVRREAARGQQVATEAAALEATLGRIDATIAQVTSSGVPLPRRANQDRDRVKQLVDQARGGLSDGTRERNLTMLMTAKKTADEAEGLATALAQDVRQLIEAERAKRFERDLADARISVVNVETLLARVDDMSARQPRQLTPEAAIEREKLRATIGRASRQLEQTNGAGNPAAVQSLLRTITSARERLERMLSVFGPLTLEDRGVPAALQEITRLYLSGDYPAVISATGRADVASFGGMAVHAHLFKAGALYMLFVRSGEKDQALLARAQAEAAAARASQPALEPDRRVFSQRFLTFYSSAPK